jgi:N-acetylmuramoyl-L-alanine amidase
MTKGRRAWLRILVAGATLPLFGIRAASAHSPTRHKQRHAAKSPQRHLAKSHPQHAAKVHPQHTAKGHPQHRLATHHPGHAAPARVRPVIVIDPGHGGADPGAIGKAGTQEKKITLQTALELKRLLAATGRYRVLLTRHDDRFVSLADRAAFAPAHGAALMISLHVDASPNRRAHGASVYVRADGPSGAGLRRVGTGESTPAAIAHALSTGQTPSPRPGSAWLQYTTIDSLNDDIQMTSSPAREAHLWVLANAGIPGVLVEMGYISNARDEALMRNPWHRLLIARSLRDAVNDYFAGLAAGPSTHT